MTPRHQQAPGPDRFESRPEATTEPKRDPSSGGTPGFRDHAAPLRARDLLWLQRLAGNKAAAFAVQRHEMPASRTGVGEDDDKIDDETVQRFVGAGASAGHDGNAFGWSRASSPTTGSLWGRPDGPTLQRKGPSPTWPKVGSKTGSKSGGKAAPLVKKAGKVADPAALQAAKEYKAFVSGGPYRINDFVPDFTENFGKFDTVYSPAGRRLTINMRVKFTFPDLPVPAVVTAADAAKAKTVRAIHKAYARNFIGQVQRGWSGRFQFKNVRQPGNVWGRLNPISVKLNVTPSTANPHYVMKAYLNKAGVANVTPNPKAGAGTVTLFKGDLNPATQGFTGSKQTGPDEAARLQRNLPKIRFANGSAAIDAKYQPDLQFVADYLRRMNQPKFTIVVVGRANKVGSEAGNQAISAKRAQAVRNELARLGVTNHTLQHKGAGTTGATADGSWRKVDFAVGVSKSFTNIQDTSLHEFGHMLGLDDEYVTTRAIQLQHQRNFMQKMLGTAAYGKGQENKYADEVTKVDPLQSASVMYSGNEVRVYHYVTLWQALYNTAATAGNQPVPAFTFNDWKVIG